MSNEPNWKPLEAVLPLDQRAGWMWMYSSQDGDRTIQHYKHRDTRGYLNLDQDGQAWRFQQVEYGCDPWCDQNHEHAADPPAVATLVPFEEALEWAMS